MAKQHKIAINTDHNTLKNTRRQEREVRKTAESILMSFGWWDGVPKPERDGDIEWESELRHMIDYLTNPNK